MAFLDKMKDSLTTAGQEVSQKAKNATETVRINNLIKANEKMIEKITYQVGLKYVNEHVHETGTEYEEMFQEILRLKKENEEHEKEITALTATNTCANCGYGNNESAKFCINCGSPMNVQPVQEEVKKICSACGHVNVPEALFCTECGNRLENVQKPAEAVVIEPVVAESAEPIMPVEVDEIPVVAQVEEEVPVVEEVPAAEPVELIEEEAPAVEPVVVEPVVAEEVPAVETASHCKNCGAVLLEDALFCTECGARRE